MSAAYVCLSGGAHGRYELFPGGEPYICIGAWSFNGVYNYDKIFHKDNAWAKANPDEVQQCYIMTGFHTAGEGPLSIPLIKGISPELMQVNTRDDPKRWWEVMDRTAGRPVPAELWRYDGETGCVVLDAPAPYHDYTVSFLAYLIWDPVHMYNAVTNSWTDFEHQITFDVRRPKTRAFTIEWLRRFCLEHPHVDVIRFTTFFHQFTLVFDELKREKYVDWYVYSASVSPYILERFEREAGYPFRPEYIIGQGYYNNQYRVPSREYQDFMAFQRREVAALARELARVRQRGHDVPGQPLNRHGALYGRVQVHWAGRGGGQCGQRLHPAADQRHSWREVHRGAVPALLLPRYLPRRGDPIGEARSNWITARRAILRSPIDRIGYGGYLKLALEAPGFMDYVESVCDELRTLYDSVRGTTPYCAKTVAVLNSWGRMRALSALVT